MKNYKFISLLILVSMLFFACKKDTTNNNNNPDDYYITFDFDGTPVEYRSTGFQGNSSKASWTSISGGIVEFTSSGVESIYVQINMEEDSITYDELQDVIGQKLEVCVSSSTVCNAPVHINLDYDDGTTEWRTDKNNNTAPTQYLKINSVEHSPTIPLGFSSLVIVEGEFSLVLDSSSGTKNATNGKFRLQFPEFK